jgi:hypothetical protein
MIEIRMQAVRMMHAMRFILLLVTSIAHFGRRLTIGDVSAIRIGKKLTENHISLLV